MSGVGGDTVRAVRRVVSDGVGEVFLDRAWPRPVAGPGEAVVRPVLLTVGPSDVAVARGEIDHRGVLGSQFVGVVESVAEGESEDVVGARVIADPAVIPSGSVLARQGLGRHDPDREILGVRGRDGCFADRCRVPIANLVRVPDGVGDEDAVLWKPLASALHASRVVPLERRNYVTVIGDGVGGILCALIMAELNQTVRLLGWSKDLSGVCERLGVRYRPAAEVGRREDQDVVIDCVGSRSSVDAAMAMARPRGSVVIEREPTPLPGVGSEDGSRVGPRDASGSDGWCDLRPMVLKELMLQGVRDGPPAEAMDRLSRGGLELSKLAARPFGRRFGFEEAIAALRSAGEPDVLRVVIEL